MATDSYTFPTNQTYEQYYQSIMESMPQREVAYKPISVEQQTQGSIADSISAALRPYYDSSIRDRQATTKTNQAELAADAYSRGMGSSTWLSDMNARQVSAEASDVADIEGQYASNLYSSVNTQYQNYLANKLSADSANASNQLATDEYNSQLKQAVQEMAWARFLDQYSMGLFNTGGGSGTTDTITLTPVTEDIVLEIAGVSAPTFGQKAYLR